MQYRTTPVSWFQKKIRGNMSVLTDHICKGLNELNLIRCKKIPKRPGADWRDLPDENVSLTIYDTSYRLQEFLLNRSICHLHAMFLILQVTLSNGLVEKLRPLALSKTAKNHNEWKGLYGRLDWQGNLPISITDPQPMGKVGMCFHPEQDRIITVRECARSQVRKVLMFLLLQSSSISNRV